MSTPKAAWSTIQADLHAVAVLTYNGCHSHALSHVLNSIDKWLGFPAPRSITTAMTSCRGSIHTCCREAQ